MRLPVFVVTHKAPETMPENGVYHFATKGIAAAIADAKIIAGKKGICIMGGPNIGEQAIESGLVDEIAINMAPVLFGSGTSFCRDLGRHIQLQSIDVVETSLATHVRYRIIKKSH
jgi:dihydrofolate reductase